MQASEHHTVHFAFDTGHFKLWCLAAVAPGAAIAGLGTFLYQGLLHPQTTVSRGENARDTRKPLVSVSTSDLGSDPVGSQSKKGPPPFLLDVLQK